MDEFYRLFNNASSDYRSYKDEVKNWEAKYGEKSLQRKLAEKQAEVKKRQEESIVHQRTEELDEIRNRSFKQTTDSLSTNSMKLRFLSVPKIYLVYEAFWFYYREFVFITVLINSFIIVLLFLSL